MNRVARRTASTAAIEAVVGRVWTPRSPVPARRRCGRTPPATGRPARSWSAGPVDGPPRCTLTMTSGSSVADRQADGLGLQRHARARSLSSRPSLRRHRTRRSPLQTAAISSSAWNVVTSESSAPVRDRMCSSGRGRGDRVGSQKPISAAASRDRGP